jgi:hypothetical protein
LTRLQKVFYLLCTLYALYLYVYHKQPTMVKSAWLYFMYFYIFLFCCMLFKSYYCHTQPYSLAICTQETLKIFQPHIHWIFLFRCHSFMIPFEKLLGKNRQLLLLRYSLKLKFKIGCDCFTINLCFLPHFYPTQKYDKRNGSICTE